MAIDAAIEKVRFDDAPPTSHSDEETQLDLLQLIG
jgi:hypothetical protein